MSKEEGKIRRTGHGVYEKDGTYFCETCDAEVMEHEHCPTCHANVDWDQVKMIVNSWN